MHASQCMSARTGSFSFILRCCRPTSVTRMQSGKWRCVFRCMVGDIFMLTDSGSTTDWCFHPVAEAVCRIWDRQRPDLLGAFTAILECLWALCLSRTSVPYVTLAYSIERTNIWSDVFHQFQSCKNRFSPFPGLMLQKTTELIVGYEISV